MADEKASEPWLAEHRDPTFQELQALKPERRQEIYRGKIDGKGETKKANDSK